LKLSASVHRAVPGRVQCDFEASREAKKLFKGNCPKKLSKGTKLTAGAETQEIAKAGDS
jgi:hypothetical protein